jgi:hypothetical protein
VGFLETAHVSPDEAVHGPAHRDCIPVNDADAFGIERLGMRGRAKRDQRDRDNKAASVMRPS